MTLSIVSECPRDSLSGGGTIDLPVPEVREKRQAFSQQVEAQLDAMYGVALRLTRDPNDAEDLVADAVSKAWKSIDSLDDWTCFRAWIFRIMRNHFISGKRRIASGPDFVPLCVDAAGEGEADLATLLHAQSDEFLKWWSDPEKDVANRLLREQILDAIAELPEAFRATVLLVNVNGLSYDEAAVAMGVPPGTVRSRMKRGRTLLQKALWNQARDAGLIEEGEGHS